MLMNAASTIVTLGSMKNEPRAMMTVVVPVPVTPLT